MAESSDTSLVVLAALRAGDAAVLQSLSNDHVLRAVVTWRLAGSLQPGDAPIARALLAQETADAREFRDATEALCTLVAIVARFADPADALLIWRAHEANRETRDAIEVEQLARLGPGAIHITFAPIATSEGPDATEAQAALAWLAAGEAAGAFDDLPAYFAWSDQRYGLEITAPT